MLLDIFRSDAFSLTSLTDAFIKAPYQPQYVGALKLFRSRGVQTTSVIVEEKAGRLSLIPTTPRGGSASNIGQQKRTARSFIVPHLERESTIMADEVQNVRAFGSENTSAAVEAIVAERLQDLRAMHEVTLEHMRVGALQGNVLDSDGSTVLFNLFTAFGVSQQNANINYNATTDKGDQLRTSIVAAQRLVENELGGDPITGYVALCGKTFFDNIRGDLGITQSLRFADPTQTLQLLPGVRSFNFGGVQWLEYRISAAVGTFVADTEAYLIPLGTNNFATYYAPADFMETANTLGLPGYAKIVPDVDLNRWVKIHTQSNPLTINLRPRAVIKLAAASV